MTNVRIVFFKRGFVQKIYFVVNLDLIFAKRRNASQTYSQTYYNTIGHFAGKLDGNGYVTINAAPFIGGVCKNTLHFEKLERPPLLMPTWSSYYYEFVPL